MQCYAVTNGAEDEEKETVFKHQTSFLHISLAFDTFKTVQEIIK